jgi:hypothetical protein
VRENDKSPDWRLRREKVREQSGVQEKERKRNTSATPRAFWIAEKKGKNLIDRVGVRVSVPFHIRPDEKEKGKATMELIQSSS